MQTFVIALIAALINICNIAIAQVVVMPARAPQCTSDKTTCEDFDAIVFVHGIYGSARTFRNEVTSFDWPSQMPARVNDRPIDVYTVAYDNALASWSKNANPSFSELAAQFLRELTPLRRRQYRSIGFIAHSLGGNVVTTYLHIVKTRLGHARRAQHAFVITLATPVLGAQMADLASEFKASVGMSDPLLNSLKANNLYLEMLQLFRIEESKKSADNGCRPINLHAAYELDRMGIARIVEPWSAKASVQSITASEVVGLARDHSQIAKPASTSDYVYAWTLAKLQSEFNRLEDWSHLAEGRSLRHQLCADVAYKLEG